MDKEVQKMAERQFQVDLPEEVLTAFDWQDAEVPKRVRETLVMELLRFDRLSEAQAAQLLGLERWEMLEIMGHYQVPAVRVNPEELKRELALGIPGRENP
tara:strand:- start:1675 stop:1974 length:300 start_codon:yes stop_codon:yes gene_type:complete